MTATCRSKSASEARTTRASAGEPEALRRSLFQEDACIREPQPSQAAAGQGEIGAYRGEIANRLRTWNARAGAVVMGLAREVSVSSAIRGAARTRASEQDGA